MCRLNLLTLLVVLVSVLGDERASAQDAAPTLANQSGESAVAKARERCVQLWSDHKFDRLRDKIPLGDQKPTFSMLKNPERLSPKDRPLAEEAVKTLEECRKAYVPVFALLPPQVNAMMQGIERRQDALIAQLYTGKISFGEYNVKADQMIGELTKVLSGFGQSAQAPSSPVAPSNSIVSNEKALSRPGVPADRSANVTPKSVSSHQIRMALVVGDSSYVSLPKLANPVRDASAVADLLRKMGFTVKLVKDATEADLRREVRKFANDSAKADIAFVYYAGHGAQVGGENYVLPIDISIPQTESDIQLTGLKVDDLVNSIRAKTKVVFLDACRDNPALFRNLVKGRGSYPKGLAPAAASNIRQENGGGGVFIAYATDSGSVALDGEGEHSPFTQALLRNLTKPISIDDMFSLVTREVRLITKNAQHPYKYASLENIVCLSTDCSSGGDTAPEGIVQQARHSESEDLQIAMQTQNPEALETYLTNYPDSSKRGEVRSAILKLRRSEFDEWTLFGLGNNIIPNYFKLNSAERFGDRVAITVKAPVDPASPLGQKFPDAAYSEDVSVYDCTKLQMASAETTTFNNSGQVVSHYKWADPQYLTLSIGAAIMPGTIASAARNILCQDHPPTPMVGKKELTTRKLKSLSSTVSGDGEIFYRPVQDDSSDKNQRGVLIEFRMKEDMQLKFPPPLSDSLTYRNELDLLSFRCDAPKFSIRKSEFYDASNNFVYVSSADFSKDISWSEFREASPYASLQGIVCTPPEAPQ
jgi:hypothetical protein